MVGSDQLISVTARNGARRRHSRWQVVWMIHPVNADIHIILVQGPNLQDPCNPGIWVGQDVISTRLPPYSFIVVNVYKIIETIFDALHCWIVLNSATSHSKGFLADLHMKELYRVIFNHPLLGLTRYRVFSVSHPSSSSNGVSWVKYGRLRYGFRLIVNRFSPVFVSDELSFRVHAGIVVTVKSASVLRFFRLIGAIIDVRLGRTTTGFGPWLMPRRT